MQLYQVILFSHFAGESVDCKLEYLVQPFLFSVLILQEFGFVSCCLRERSELGNLFVKQNFFIFPVHYLLVQTLDGCPEIKDNIVLRKVGDLACI